MLEFFKKLFGIKTCPHSSTYVCYVNAGMGKIWICKECNKIVKKI